jgi:hypothetical protein
MESPGWPQTHEDGSTTVGVRFARAPEVQPDVLQGIVTTWLADLQESGHDPLDDLLAMPRVEVRGPTLIEVVVDAKPGSRFWSDELVSLAVHIHEQKTGFSVLALHDRVGGGVRSLEPAGGEGGQGVPPGIDDALLAIARGERPVQSVDSLNTECSGSARTKFYQDPSKQSIPCVPVSWQDLAVGFLHYFSRQHALEEWASFVLTDYCEFPEERGHDAERFLSALHDVANGGPPSTGILELAERLSVRRLD